MPVAAAVPAASYLIPAAASVAGSIGSWFSGRSSIAQQQDWQRDNMRLQQQNWEKQFNMTNEYNDPKNVVQRYFAAGISPSAAFGGSTVGQSSASPSLGAIGSPVGFPSWIQNPMQGFSSIAQALSSLGSHFQSSALGKSLLQKLGLELENMQIDNETKQFYLKLDKLNLPKRQQWEIKNLIEENNKLRSDVNVANQTELLAIEQRYKTIAERMNEITRGKLLDVDFQNWQRNWDSIIENRRSQNAANYGAARQSNASADRESYFNQLRAEPSVRESLLKELKQVGDKAVAEKKLTRAEADKAYHQAEMAAFADDLKQFDWAFDKALKTAKGVYDGVSSLSKLIGK